MQRNPCVYITRKIPDAALDVIGAHFEYRIWPEEDRPVPRDILERELAGDGTGGVQALLTLLTERIDAKLLDKAPNLTVVANMAVGYDNIDIRECQRRGIVVTNTPGVLTETTADLAFALLLATARRLTEAERFLRNGRWKTWSPMLLTGLDVHGATLGIVGLGSIGEAVARRALGFGMRVLYTSPSPKPRAEERLNRIARVFEYGEGAGCLYVSLEELLRESDFVSIHVPLTPETRGMIGSRELALMKPSACLINTSRGPVVDEDALLEALSGKRIFAAGLDVFQTEPLPTSSPLLRLDNVVLLPHIGSASVATRTKMAVLAAKNIVSVMNGKGPLNPVF